MVLTRYYDTFRLNYHILNVTSISKFYCPNKVDVYCDYSVKLRTDRCACSLLLLSLLMD